MKSSIYVTSNFSVYYIGIGASCFLRTITSHFVGLQNKVMIKQCLLKIVLFIYLLGIICSLLILLFHKQISKLFFYHPDELKLFESCLLIYSFHLSVNYSLPAISSIFRFLEMKLIGFIALFILFNGLCSICSYILYSEFDAGVIGAMISFLISDYMTVTFLLVWLWFTFDKQIDKTMSRFI